MNAQGLMANLHKLADQYALIAIYAFGSRASGILAKLQSKQVHETFSQSDLDIGVLPVRDKHLSAVEKVQLAQAIEDIFEVHRVDLVVLPEAPPYLALDIVRGELLYTCDEDAEAEYQLYILRRAGDLAHFERARQALVLGAGA